MPNWYTISAAAVFAAILVLLAYSPAATSKTVRACTDVKLPTSGCKTTRRTVHGYSVKVVVCK